MKDDHLTLRLPRDLVRALARLARARRVSRSAVVREAVTHYLGAGEVPTSATRPSITAAELADRWPRLPRLTPEDAADFAAEIAAVRRSLPSPRQWE
jgi:predicted transcriptional regulator